MDLSTLDEFIVDTDVVMVGVLFSINDSEHDMESEAVVHTTVKFFIKQRC